MARRGCHSPRPPAAWGTGGRQGRLFALVPSFLWFRSHWFYPGRILVVITIIGILIALLLPAVQAAREAARTTQCQNNIKQLALGCLGHESATKRFPTGGWGWAWTGDPNRGNDWRQPGGWIYNVLPYIEQQPLHDLGAGLGLATAAELAAATQCAVTPLAVLYCPTRRPAVVYPWSAQSWFTFRPGNMNRPVSGVARNDYAICGGDVYTYPYWPHPIQAPYAGPRKLRLCRWPAVPRRAGRGRRDDEPSRLSAPAIDGQRRVVLPEHDRGERRDRWT